MNTKKILGAIASLNILQVILTLSIIGLMQRGSHEQLKYVMYVSCILMCFTTVITLISFLLFNKAKNNNLQESIKNLEELNKTLRKQRHDYLNQMQVVYGLLDLGEAEEAKHYMDDMLKEILKLSKALRTAQPAVNALLQAKLQMAEKQGIDMYLDIKADLKYLKLPAWELCKVLANIIDNGITALSNQEKNKRLDITIEQTLNGYHFEIKNNGPQIPTDQLETIFREGYTTKKDQEEHGMGLAIVKEIVEEAKGSIRVTSNEQVTCFVIELE